MGLEDCKDSGDLDSRYAVFCPRCGRPGTGERQVSAIVVYVDIGFWSLVRLMAKGAFASIPALIPIALICGTAFVAIAGFSTMPR